MTHLSGYRIMWLMVMFDLPTNTKPERRAATRFRNYLLDQGYERSQFSIYLRLCSGKEQVERRLKDLSGNLPKTGKVHVLAFTDKQYENIVCFNGRTRDQGLENPDQLTLF